MITQQLLRYHFRFSFKDFAGDLWEYPCIVDTLDTAGADREAYRSALISFGNSIILNRNFVAPETLTIKVRKEILREVTLDESEKEHISRN